MFAQLKKWWIGNNESNKLLDEMQCDMDKAFREIDKAFREMFVANPVKTITISEDNLAKRIDESVAMGYLVGLVDGWSQDKSERQEPIARGRTDFAALPDSDYLRERGKQSLANITPEARERLRQRPDGAWWTAYLDWLAAE